MRRRTSFLAALSFASSAWADEVGVSPAVKDEAGILVHAVQSEYQSAKTKIRVLLPRPLEKGKRYPVLYVLPVEPADGVQWGDGLREVEKNDLHNKYGMICVQPTFSADALVRRSSDRRQGPAGNLLPQGRGALHRPDVSRRWPSGGAAVGRLQQIGMGSLQPVAASPGVVRKGGRLGCAADDGAT